MFASGSEIQFWLTSRRRLIAERMSLPTKVLRIADQGKRPSSIGERRKDREQQLQRAYGTKASNDRPKDVLKRFGVSQRRDSEFAGLLHMFGRMYHLNISTLPCRCEK
jgi:hypothetical protein